MEFSDKTPCYSRTWVFDVRVITDCPSESLLTFVSVQCNLLLVLNLERFQHYWMLGFTKLPISLLHNAFVYIIPYFLHQTPPSNSNRPRINAACSPCRQCNSRNTRVLAALDCIHNIYNVTSIHNEHASTRTCKCKWMLYQLRRWLTPPSYGKR